MKKRIILILLISIIIPLFISALLIYDSVFSDSKNLKDSTDNSSQEPLEQSIWDSIEQSQLDTLELNIEIDGYRIIPTKANFHSY